MKPLLIALLLLPMTLSAQVADTAASNPIATVTEAASLQPFVAQYQVFKSGSALGEATMQVVRQPKSRWRVDLVMEGTRGLFGLAGVNAEQSTVFDAPGETYRPLTQATVNRTVFTRKKTVGIYDWASGSASWQGDIKKTRTQPVALQPRDMSGLLINLAVIRDAEPGRTLQYRFVDNGRVRQHEYRVAENTESVRVGDISYNAMRVERVEKGNEETVIWVVKGVPTPIRMLQREAGEDTYDLRLVEYKGV